MTCDPLFISKHCHHVLCSGSVGNPPAGKKDESIGSHHEEADSDLLWRDKKPNKISASNRINLIFNKMDRDGVCIDHLNGTLLFENFKISLTTYYHC